MVLIVLFLRCYIGRETGIKEPKKFVDDVQNDEDDKSEGPEDVDVVVLDEVQVISGRIHMAQVLELGEEFGPSDQSFFRSEWTMENLLAQLLNVL